MTERLAVTLFLNFSFLRFATNKNVHEQTWPNCQVKFVCQNWQISNLMACAFLVKFVRQERFLGDFTFSLKIVFFSQFTATHPRKTHRSVQSLLLVGHFCTANSSPVLAKWICKRSQNIDISWKKTQYLMNTLYVLTCDEIDELTTCCWA